MLRQSKTYFLRGFSILAILFCLSSCEKEINPRADVEWEISENEIGGSLTPWPLIDDPAFSNIANARQLDPEEKIFVYKGSKHLYVFPVKEMTRVEIVNFKTGQYPVSVTYCPLTKSALAWKSTYGQDTLSFTPSGYLFHSNLLPYDYQTQSIWSQMRLEGVRGKHAGRKLQYLPLLETRWSTILPHFPEALIFTGTNETGQSRLQSPSQNKDGGPSSRKASDGLIFGILNGLRIDLFPDELFGDDIRIINIRSDQGVFVAGSNKLGFVMAYESPYPLQPVPDAFPVIMKDNSGSRWNVFGEAVSGPRKGEQLTPATSYRALHWAWEGIFKDREIHIHQFVP